MIKRMNRRINSETTRKLLNWSYFEFRHGLKHKVNSVLHEFEVKDVDNAEGFIGNREHQRFSILPLLSM
jgi:hypothetical protein